MKVSALDFMHPEDRAALDNLRSIPLFTPCVQAFMKALPERQLHGMNMAQKIRLGPHQLPEIYGYLPPACATLGIAEPEFYLEMDPRPNAYTYGDRQTFLTVTSGLVEYMEEDEMQAVVVHECGHIACRHVLYHTMAMLLLKYGARIFGPMAALSVPVQLALLYWSRRSELSADRAAAVVMQQPQPVVDTMIRLAGGPKSITGKINLELYMQQAEAYDKLLESQWDQLLQGISVMGEDHPFLAIRTREIVRWCEGEQFQGIVQALREQPSTTKCASCGAVVEANWKFCRDCGAPLPPPNEGQDALPNELQ